jgi:hypothetical protein
MADGRKNNGGKREGAGRPPKADELLLIEKLSPLDEEAFKQLKDGIRSGDFQYVKMFFEYRFGKPKQTIDQNTTGSMQIIWNEAIIDNEPE